METVASPPEPNAVELRLLTAWGQEDDRHRRREAGFISILFHVAAIIGLAVMPSNFLAGPRPAAVARRTITPLVAPLSEPTQITPNKGPLSKEFDAEALRPRPRIQVPPSPPSTSRAPALHASIPAPRPAPAPVLAEPPRIDASARQAPPSMSPLAQVAPPPQIQAVEKPTLQLEDPAKPMPAPALPGGGLLGSGNPVQDAIRSGARGGSSGGLAVGDLGGEPGMGGIGAGINMPPSPGRQASNLELLSDPMGVDFRPYLIKILAAVRRNWFAVMPESAKWGRHGRVTIQFAIARNGAVPKLVIVGHSGTDSLDRAAVAGISASNPFPPLPTEFRGERVLLQFNFLYNVPRN